MKKYIQAGFILCILFSSLAQAGITIGATRVIYHGNAKDESVSIINSDNKPFLIQSWAQSINTDGTIGDAPFIVTPPLFRLNAGQKNVLRVIRTGGNLPEDRESLYWLDIKSIPPSDAANHSSQLKLAVKAEFKLIYRPASLKQTPEQVADQLKWREQNNNLIVDNPTPYYMNFAIIEVDNSRVKTPLYVAPFGSTQYPLSKGNHRAVSWSLITDFGGTSATHKQSL
ncbi:TPA: fimbria/pilus periplasmic chaperone [Salmonella enterica]|nr:fimbria/pilus periplasmic chaperone [Salmonella enterica]